MAFEVEGTLVSRFPVASGSSARGTWKKQECIVEYQEGKFPSKLCLAAWGDDLINTIATLPDGSRVKVSFDVASREYQGRWYTDVKIWKIAPAQGAAQAATPAQPAFTTPQGVYNAPAGTPEVPAYATPDYSNLEAEQDEDLPF